MTLTLHVHRGAWEANVRDVAARYGDVIAVVKGNGYGFGLGPLAITAADLGFRRLAVGTVHELDALPPLDEPPIVLTPAPELSTPLPPAVLTVGSITHVEALARRADGVAVAVAV